MKTLFITLLSLIIATTSYYEEKPKTEVVKENRSLSGFNTIHTRSSINVILKQGDNESVIVETNVEFQKQVLTSVEEGVLKIEVKGKVINPTEFKVHVTVTNIEDISCFGSGDIRSIGVLTFPVLNFSINGSGDLRVKLNSETVTIKIKGSGKIKLKGEMKDLKINSFGSSDIYLSGNVNNFDIEAFGSGNLYGKKFKAIEVNAKYRGSGDVVIAVEEIINTVIIGSGDFKIIGNPCVKNLEAIGPGDFY